MHKYMLKNMSGPRAGGGKGEGAGERTFFMIAKIHLVYETGEEENELC